MAGGGPGSAGRVGRGVHTPAPRELTPSLRDAPSAEPGPPRLAPGAPFVSACKPSRSGTPPPARRSCRKPHAAAPRGAGSAVGSPFPVHHGPFTTETSASRGADTQTCFPSTGRESEPLVTARIFLNFLTVASCDAGPEGNRAAERPAAGPKLQVEHARCSPPGGPPACGTGGHPLSHEYPTQYATNGHSHFRTALKRVLKDALKIHLTEG